MGLGHGLELTPCEGCESLALLPPGSATLPSLRQPPYGRVSERVILRNDPESESESIGFYKYKTTPNLNLNQEMRMGDFPLFLPINHLV